MTAAERETLERNTRVYGGDNGYYIQQATRPHSIGPALEPSVDEPREPFLDQL